MVIFHSYVKLPEGMWFPFLFDTMSLCIFLCLKMPPPKYQTVIILLIKIAIREYTEISDKPRYHMISYIIGFLSPCIPHFINIPTNIPSLIPLLNTPKKQIKSHEIDAYITHSPSLLLVASPISCLQVYKNYIYIIYIYISPSRKLLNPMKSQLQIATSPIVPSASNLAQDFRANAAPLQSRGGLRMGLGTGRPGLPPRVDTRQTRHVGGPKTGGQDGPILQVSAIF